MVILLAIGADYGGKMVFKYGAGTDLFLKVNPDAADHDHDDHDHDHDHDKGQAKAGPTLMVWRMRTYQRLPEDGRELVDFIFSTFLSG